MEQFWGEIIRILDVTKVNKATKSSEVVWPLYCELASHFARHIESLHPGQDGIRVACNAWWLAAKVGEIFGRSDDLAKALFDQVVNPETKQSFWRWTFAGSPVTPSSFRYATLSMSSVWAMSLLAQLSQSIDSLALEEVPSESMKRISEILRGYLITGPLADHFDTSTPVFAFQENLPITVLCNRVVPAEECEVFAELIQFRERLADTSELQSRLKQLRDLPPHEQHLTLMFLKDAVFSTQKMDDVISPWLSETREFVEDLRALPEPLLVATLETLAEFQLRHRPEWGTRLPHIIAYAIEGSDEEQWADRLFPFTLLTSINGGIVSPIQRVLSSKWRSKLIEPLRNWRESMVEVSKYSEPWVRARTRATSAAISRLIGPRSHQMPISRVPS